MHAYAKPVSTFITRPCIRLQHTTGVALVVCKVCTEKEEGVEDDERFAAQLSIQEIKRDF